MSQEQLQITINEQEMAELEKFIDTIPTAYGKHILAFFNQKFHAARMKMNIPPQPEPEPNPEPIEPEQP